VDAGASAEKLASGASSESEQEEGGNVIPLRREASFAEAQLRPDIVDQAVEQIMADEGWRQGWDPIIAPLVEELARAGSEAEVQAILARAAELDDEADLADRLTRAGFAVRLAASAGADAK
jgi:phage gp29-like protein